MEVDDIEPIEQVLPELPFLHQIRQLFVRGSNDANVHFDRRALPHPSDFPLLDRAQQLRLNLGSKVADFIEEKRAAGGLFKQPPSKARGAGEGALGMPEKLGFDQRLGDSTAVNRHEWAVCSLRTLMEDSSDLFLSGAGFPRDQNRNQRSRGAGNLLVDLEQRGAAAH